MLIIVLSFFVVSILAYSAIRTIYSVDEKMTRYCFDELENAAKRLAEDVRREMEMDRSILSAMAPLIALKEEILDEDVLPIMNSFDADASYVDFLELLTPDDRLLHQNGTAINSSGKLDFKRQAELGKYISDKDTCVYDENEAVIRNVVPVVRNGETVAVLIGVVTLSRMARLYKTDIYDGNASVYIENGATGDFIIDTWHKTLGNIRDFNNRKTLPGYSFDKALDDMANGRNGDLGFISKTVGKPMFLHYEPVGIDKWNVLVSVTQEEAYKKTRFISDDMLIMAIVEGTVLIVYMMCIAAFMYGSYKTMRRMSREDQLLGVLNRNAFDAYVDSKKNAKFKSVSVVYFDVNGLHDINNKYGHSAGDKLLKAVAEALKEEFPYSCVYRIGGDEFIILLQDAGYELCDKKTNDVIKRINEYGYSVSVGLVCLENVTGFDEAIRRADDNMLENKRAYYEKNNISANR